MHLHRSLERFRNDEHAQLWWAVVSGLPEGMLVVQGQVVRYANPALARCFGYEQAEALQGVSLAELFGSAAAAEGADEASRTWEGWGRRRDGSQFPIELSESRVEVSEETWRVLIVRDISERRRLEQQYRDAQKMQVVGRLVGGIVHDFNNLLTATMIYAGMLLGRLRAGSRQHYYAQEIERASERGATLAGQLLALARQQPSEPKPVALNEFLASKRELLQRMVGEQVVVKMECAPRLDEVRIDPFQLDQVLLNLAANSRDAMPNGGVLTVEAASQEVTPSIARSHLGLLPGRYVTLSVRDTGCGMDANTRAHLFEPFFTTKEQGKGTGLGLTTVYGILAQAGGRIYVESEVGRGTEVVMFLPSAADSTTTTAEPHAANAACVLLVEDEELVRRPLQETLEAAGFEALVAEDGPHALRLARAHAGRLAALITDMVMPGMNGQEVAERVREMRPDLPVIYMSGYTAEGNLERLRAAGAVCLKKPFAPRVLVAAARQAVAQLEGVGG